MTVAMGQMALVAWMKLQWAFTDGQSRGTTHTLTHTRTHARARAHTHARTYTHTHTHTHTILLSVQLTAISWGAGKSVHVYTKKYCYSKLYIKNILLLYITVIQTVYNFFSRAVKLNMNNQISDLKLTAWKNNYLWMATFYRSLSCLLNISEITVALHEIMTCNSESWIIYEVLK